MGWYWFVGLLVAVFFWRIANHCRLVMKENARVLAVIDWRFAVGNLNVYRGYSVILDHQLGYVVTSQDTYDLLLARHGRARCLWCYQRTEAVIPKKSLHVGGMAYRSLACNKCGCFILNDEVAHIYRR